jgi:hypothetical protein
MIERTHARILAFGLLVAACSPESEYTVPTIPWWACAPGDLLGCEDDQQVVCTEEGHWEALSCASLCADVGLPEPARCDENLDTCVCGVLGDECSSPGVEWCNDLVLRRCDRSLYLQPVQDCSTACEAHGYGTPTCSLEGCRCDLLAGPCPPELEGVEVCDAGSGEGVLAKSFRRCVAGVWEDVSCPIQGCEGNNYCVPTSATTVGCECR